MYVNVRISACVAYGLFFHSLLVCVCVCVWYAWGCMKMNYVAEEAETWPTSHLYPRMLFFFEALLLTESQKI